TARTPPDEEPARLCRAGSPARGPEPGGSGCRRAEQQEQEGRMMAELSSLEELGSIAPQEPAAPVHVQKLDAHGRAYATGKRKDAIARVWIKPGKGRIVIN